MATQYIKMAITNNVINSKALQNDFWCENICTIWQPCPKDQPVDQVKNHILKNYRVK
jgi:hypothetical protein